MHPPGGVLLLARRVQILPQHRVDQTLTGSSRGAGRAGVNAEQPRLVRSEQEELLRGDHRA